MQEMWVPSLGWEDPLEKEMTTHTPIFLPGKSHVQRSLADCSPRGRKELDTARLVTKYQPQHDLYAAFLLGDRQRYRGMTM